jgi:hypothetical protein
MLLKDMTTLKPVPRGYILFGDPPVQYPIMSVVDLTYAQMIDLMETASTEGENLSASVPKLMVTMRKQIKSIAPTLTDAVLDTMSYRNLIDFINAAMGSGENPPQATEVADSASSTS